MAGSRSAWLALVGASLMPRLGRVGAPSPNPPKLLLPLCSVPGCALASPIKPCVAVSPCCSLAVWAPALILALPYTFPALAGQRAWGRPVSCRLLLALVVDMWILEPGLDPARSPGSGTRTFIEGGTCLGAPGREPTFQEGNARINILPREFQDQPHCTISALRTMCHSVLVLDDKE